MKDSKVSEMNLRDVANMSNAKIKELIRKVDADELVVVLKDATEDVRDRIIPNLGVRAKKKLDELEAGMKKFKKSDLLKYTDNIEKELRKLFK